MYGFVYRSPSAAADVLCGALAPSRDSAGRAFPLAVAAPLQASTELLRRPELLPFVLEDAWARLTEACAHLMSEGRFDPAALPELAGTPAEPVADAAQVYDDWVSSLELAELWALLGPALSAPALTLQVLLETLKPARGVERPRTTLALRLPLGRAGGAALCAWLDLVRRGAGWQSTLPSFFWSHDGTDGAALLSLGAPSKAALAEIWMPSGQRDDVVDLTLPVSPGWLEACAPLPDGVSAVLAAPRATVSDLLAAFTGP